jgi:hypothetical protein
MVAQRRLQVAVDQEAEQAFFGGLGADGALPSPDGGDLVELQGPLDLGDGEYRLTRVPQASVNAEQLSATAGLVGSWRFDGEAELTLQDDTGEPLELQGRLSRP